MVCKDGSLTGYYLWFRLLVGFPLGYVSLHIYIGVPIMRVQRRSLNSLSLPFANERRIRGTVIWFIQNVVNYF